MEKKKHLGELIIRTDSGNSKTSKKKLSEYSSESDTLLYNQAIYTLEKVKDLIFAIDTKSMAVEEYFSFYFNVSEELVKDREKLIGFVETNHFQITPKKIYYVFYTIFSDLLAKIYLLSIAGFILCRSNFDEFYKVMDDIITLIELVEYPIAKFFVRYFVFKTFFEFLEKSPLDYSEAKLTDNIIKMNHLLNLLLKEANAQILHVLIVENINNLLNLPGMDIQRFKKNNLQKISSLIIEEDKGTLIYSEYILDWGISGMNEENLIVCLDYILDMMAEVSELDQSIAKKANGLIERILGYYRHSVAKEQQKITETLHGIVDKSYETFSKILFSKIEVATEQLKLYMDYCYSFLQFLSISLYKDEYKQYSQLFSMLDKYILSIVKNQNNLSISSINSSTPIKVYVVGREHSQIFGKMCKELALKKVNIFMIERIMRIVGYFDSEEKSMLSNILLRENIISLSLVIDSEKKVYFCVEAIKSILNYNSELKTDDKREEKEKKKEKQANRNKASEGQVTISSVIKLIYNSNPHEYLKCLLIMKNIFDKNDSKIMKISLKEYLLSMLKLADCTEKAYTHSGSPEKYIDVKNYNDDMLWDFFKTVYMILCDDIQTKFNQYSETNLSFTLEAIDQINKVSFKRNYFVGICNAFFQLFNHILNEIQESSVKVKYIKKAIEIVVNITILPKERYLEVVNKIIASAKLVKQRADTAKLLVLSCDMYYNDNLVDKEKIKSNLAEAEKNGIITLIKPENLEIFTYILNKMVFYYKKCEYEIVEKEDILRIIKIIQEHLPKVAEANSESFQKINIAFEKEMKSYDDIERGKM